jgi:hypothetical protein
MEASSLIISEPAFCNQILIIGAPLFFV